MNKRVRIPNSTRNVLSAKTVQAICERGLYADGGNLYLQVGPNGGKSWIFRYTLDGRMRNMGVGPVVDVSLAEARRKAHLLRDLLRDGLDPLDERGRQFEQRRRERTGRRLFQLAAEEFIATNGATWSTKHAGQWKATLETYAFPVIGKRSVAEIAVTDLEAILRPIWNQKRETANRVRGRIEDILDREIALGNRADSNPARWLGTLKPLFGTGEGKSAKKVQHLAALPYSEAPAFMAALREVVGVGSLALQFTILTAARTGEVIAARRSEFNTTLWTVPGERMKSGFEHRVPLSKQALAVFEALPELAGGWAFPGHKQRSHLSNMAMLAVLNRKLGRSDITVHGFRSTFRDWIAETTATPNMVAEKCLAHSLGDKTEAAYRRGDLLERRRPVMQAWADFLDGKDSANADHA